VRKHVALGIVGCVMAVAGCSSSPHQKTLTTADADAIAVAGILTPADMPGYDNQPNTQSSDDIKHDADVSQCIGLGAQVLSSENNGTSFLKGDNLEIDSSANMTETVGGAKQWVTAWHSDKVSSCYKQEILGIIAKTAGTTLDSFQATPSHLSVKGADGTFEEQFTGKLSGSGTTETNTDIIAGARVGRVEIRLEETSIPTDLISQSQLTSLLELLVTRVKAAS
jgi:hypothetical protein